MFLGQQIFWVKFFSWVKKDFFGQTIFESKNLGQQIFGHKNFWVKKIFGSKRFGSKQFLDQKDLGPIFFVKKKQVGLTQGGGYMTPSENRRVKIVLGCC